MIECLGVSDGADGIGVQGRANQPGPSTHGTHFLGWGKRQKQKEDMNKKLLSQSGKYFKGNKVR